MDSLANKGLVDPLLDTLEKMETEKEVIPLQLNRSREPFAGEQVLTMNIATQHVIEEDQQFDFSEMSVHWFILISHMNVMDYHNLVTQTIHVLSFLGSVRPQNTEFISPKYITCCRDTQCEKYLARLLT